VDRVAADNRVCRLKTVKKNERDVKKSKSASKRPDLNESAGKRKSKESTTLTNVLKVSALLITHLSVLPTSKCRLRLLRQERVKDYILMEQEFIQNQERLKP
jgi:26S proteasome regulatory subunit T2